MNKTLWMTTTSLMILGLAGALPAASACAAAGGDDPVQQAVADAANYACSLEPANDGLATGRFVLNETRETAAFVRGEAEETIAFVEETYGDDLP